MQFGNFCRAWLHFFSFFSGILAFPTCLSLFFFFEICSIPRCVHLVLSFIPFYTLFRSLLFLLCASALSWKNIHTSHIAYKWMCNKDYLNLKQKKKINLANLAWKILEILTIKTMVFRRVIIDSFEIIIEI